MVLPKPTGGQTVIQMIHKFDHWLLRRFVHPGYASHAVGFTWEHGFHCHPDMILQYIQRRIEVEAAEPGVGLIAEHEYTNSTKGWKSIDTLLGLGEEIEAAGALNDLRALPTHDVCTRRESKQ